MKNKILLLLTGFFLLTTIFSCTENAVDPEDFAYLTGDWVLTRIYIEDNGNLEVGTPQDYFFYLFLSMYDNEEYDYVLLDETGLKSGSGDWYLNGNTITFENFEGRTISGVYNFKIDQFEFTSDDGFPFDADRFTFEYTFDTYVIMPQLVGSWDLIRTDYYTSQGNSSTFPDKEKRWVSIDLYSDGFYVDEVRDNSGTNYQEGSWNVFFDVLRTYYDNGDLVVNRFLVEGDNLILIYNLYDAVLREIIEVQEIYLKR